MKNSDIKLVVERLKQADLPHTEFVDLMENYKNPFLVLISCILSLRTNDKTTYPATLRMLKLGKTPQELAKVSVEELEKAIYPVGFYKNKAKQIIEISKYLCENEMPHTIGDLCKFNGVGRKTANLVMAKGFCEPAICVDVHVHRISNRLGYVKTKSPDDTELVLRKKLPKEYWLDINTLLVTFGQNICKPQKPNCEKCMICEFCDFYKNNKRV
ncbi:MAG: endonuclease III [bacterium]|nr:endonuclease III [bacterium]